MRWEGPPSIFMSLSDSLIERNKRSQCEQTHGVRRLCVQREIGSLKTLERELHDEKISKNRMTAERIEDPEYRHQGVDDPPEGFCAHTLYSKALCFDSLLKQSG